MNVKPLKDRVLIKAIEPEEVTKSGIILAGGVKEKPQVAEIIELGDKVINNDGLKKGDRIIYTKYAGNKIKLEGKEYIIVRINEILAVIK